MKTIPKECVNRKCNNIIYVERYMMHIDPLCEKCITKNNLKN